MNSYRIRHYERRSKQGEGCWQQVVFGLAISLVTLANSAVIVENLSTKNTKTVQNLEFPPLETQVLRKQAENIQANNHLALRYTNTGKPEVVGYSGPINKNPSNPLQKLENQGFATKTSKNFLRRNRPSA